MDNLMNRPFDESNIPYALPFIGKEEEDAVLKVLRSGWITTAQEALSFEKEFIEFFEARGASPALHALAVNSSTSGLHLALEACAVTSGDVVIVPADTFAATAEVARHLGAELAFVDCAEGGFNLDITSLEKTLSRLAAGKSAYENGGPSGKPRAVVPVHFGGLPCDMTTIVDMCKQVGAAVVEDSAHAFPAQTTDSLLAGTIGDVGVFSFYATKTITTGEGGMVVCSDPDLAKRISIMRLHGIDRPIWNRYSAQALQAESDVPPWYYQITEAGYKYNLCDILAAIGRVQLRRADFLFNERKKIAARYDAAFDDCEKFILPPTSIGDARHLYPLRISHNCKVNRNKLISDLKDRSIGCSVHFIPLHIMPYYKNRYDLKSDDFPHAMANFESELSLPLWPGMTDRQIERVITAVLELAN
ncbi:MAG: DegT/DnrJ/EryC1/StrS aminotransferase family protein [Termitinemataceae bacterium]|nr:MAG: DegT/DnrJ/EryC1/StrS aminotransferase family protein [Termitinemataceae bacterium]